DLQLPIYLLACEQLFEEPVRTAGYAYVGEQGPRIDLREFTDADLDRVREQLSDRLSDAAESSFGAYTAGDHCKYCPHR
uniref:PD-(D/E)XK nuclease family protein n=1 Tax=Halostella sp. PRR32 TaxID=3098147 RepID=UPI002B1D0A4E